MTRALLLAALAIAALAITAARLRADARRWRQWDALDADDDIDWLREFWTPAMTAAVKQGLAEHEAERLYTVRLN